MEGIQKSSEFYPRSHLHKIRASEHSSRKDSEKGYLVIAIYQQNP